MILVYLKRPLAALGSLISPLYILLLACTEEVEVIAKILNYLDKHMYIQDRTKQDSEPRLATHPYISGISETLAQHLRSLNIKVEHKPTVTVRTILVKAKDTIPLDAKVGVIYQVPCKGCNAKYGGETGKTLKNWDETTQSGSTQPLHVLPHSRTPFEHRPPIRF